MTQKLIVVIHIVTLHRIKAYSANVENVNELCVK